MRVREEPDVEADVDRREPPLEAERDDRHGERAGIPGVAEVLADGRPELVNGHLRRVEDDVGALLHVRQQPPLERDGLGKSPVLREGVGAPRLGEAVQEGPVLAVEEEDAGREPFLQVVEEARERLDEVRVPDVEDDGVLRPGRAARRDLVGEADDEREREVVDGRCSRRPRARFPRRTSRSPTAPSRRGAAGRPRFRRSSFHPDPLEDAALLAPGPEPVGRGFLRDLVVDLRRHLARGVVAPALQELVADRDLDEEREVAARSPPASSRAAPERRGCPRTPRPARGGRIRRPSTQLRQLDDELHGVPLEHGRDAEEHRDVHDPEARGAPCDGG